MKKGGLDPKNIGPEAKKMIIDHKMILREAVVMIGMNKEEKEEI